MGSAATVSSSTRLNISTGEGGQGEEDAAMYFAPKKVGKKAAPKKVVAAKARVAPAWQTAFTKAAPKKAKPAPVKKAKPAPVKKAAPAKKAAPVKKAAPKKVAAKAAPEKKKAGGFSFGGLGKKAAPKKEAAPEKKEAPKKKGGFSFGKL